MAVIKKTRRLTWLNGRTVDYLAVDEVVPDEKRNPESTDGDLTVHWSSGGATVGKIIDLDLVKVRWTFRGQLGDLKAANLPVTGTAAA